MKSVQFGFIRIELDKFYFGNWLKLLEITIFTIL